MYKRQVYDGLRDRLIAMAEATKLGDGTEQGTTMGPIQNSRQFERVQDLLQDAKDSGLNVIECSDMPDANGYFIPITIVDNPPEHTRVVQEEAFGPILPMLKFTDVESFYQRIREHPILGPIFNDAIGDNWPHHLAQMKNFWASVTMNMGRYSGQPVPAHKKHLGSIQKWHFSCLLYTSPSPRD